MTTVTDKNIIQLVIMAGQSNMVGYRTRLDDLAPKWQEPIGNCLFWNGRKWIALQAGKIAKNSAFGPELSLGHDLGQDSNGPVGIVKVAKVASYLSKQWDPEAENALFDNLVKQVRLALHDRPAVLRGLVWMQGEADSINLDDAKAYRDRFTCFVDKFRNAIGAPNLPVIAGIVNPPSDSCPHAKYVRDALTENKIEHYYSVPLDDLKTKNDNLHLTVPGLSKLGKRFAGKIREASDNVSSQLVYKWLWDSDQYQCWYSGPTISPKAATVTFPFAVVNSGFDEPGFAQSYFEQCDRPTFYIRSNRSLWFQRKEIFEVADQIRKEFGLDMKLTLYGASMGAFGALLVSGRLKPECVIAVAPQYSIDRKVVPWEKRWSRAAKRIGEFDFSLDEHADPDAKKIIFYDGMSLDNKQVALMPNDPSWVKINLPFSSHQVLRYLQETGTLRHLLEQTPFEKPDIDKIVSMARLNRQKSAIYWMTLAQMHASRRPLIAKFAYEKAMENGGPVRRIRPQLEKLDLD